MSHEFSRLDYSFYTVPCDLTDVFAEYGFSAVDVADIEQVPDFMVFGEYDYDGLGHALLAVRQTDGKVCRVDVEAWDPVVLMNSSLQLFMDTFCFLDNYLGHGQLIPADLDSLVRNLDPTVYSESWWRLLIEHVSPAP